MADTKALVRAKTLKRKDTDMLGSNPNLLHQIWLSLVGSNEPDEVQVRRQVQILPNHQKYLRQGMYAVRICKRSEEIR